MPHYKSLPADCGKFPISQRKRHSRSRRLLSCEADHRLDPVHRDLPKPAEHEELGLRYTYNFKARTVKLECIELDLVFEEIRDDYLAETIANSELGDKLAGWPAWIQNVEYPSCPVADSLPKPSRSGGEQPFAPCNPITWGGGARPAGLAVIDPCPVPCIRRSPVSGAQKRKLENGGQRQPL